MVNAWNIAAAWANIAGNGTLTTSSATTAMPITNLQQQDILRNWRSGATTTATVYLTFASNQSADTFSVLNTNLTAAGIVRVGLYPTLTDAGAGTNVIYDSNSGSTPGQVDPNYKKAVVLASSVQTGWKTVRVDLTDTSLSYIEAGFLVVSTRTQYTYNYNFGATLTVVDPSVRKKTKGGQSRIMVRPKFYQADITVGFLTQTQRWNVVDAMDRANGASVPVLFILDPSSSNLSRDSIFGFIESSPVTTIQAFDSGPLYQKPYKIEQRL